PTEVLSEIGHELERAAGALEGYPQGTLYEGFAEPANAPSPQAFFDHSPFMGAAHPIAPPMELWPDGGRIVGRVRFGAADEGPPAAVLSEVGSRERSRAGGRWSPRCAPRPSRSSTACGPPRPSGAHR